MNFNGKVILITGGGQGIGAEVARHMTRLGAKVSLVDINENHLIKLADEIIKSGQSKPLPIVADVTTDAERIIRETIKEFGQLDVLINNAGILNSDSVSDFDVNRYDQIMNTNLRSMIVLTNLAVPHLEKTKGNIVNVSSVAGIIASRNHLSYCISKAGVNQFTKCAALTLAPKGIRVNAVNPGVIRTSIYTTVGIIESNEDAFFDEYKRKTLVDRVGHVSDISSGIAYLASESFVNGTLLTVDGGLMCKRS